MVEPRIIGGILIIVFFAVIVIGMDKIDPYYRTSDIVEGKIISKAHFIGKSGGALKVIVEIDNGKTYEFSQSSKSHKGVGDKVKLRLYKRKITGFGIYKLER